jgi:signal transduction histidine kinase
VTTPAEQHGAVRAESGFTVEQMVAEYRALRASVIRLWTKASGELAPRASRAAPGARWRWWATCWTSPAAAWGGGIPVVRAETGLGKVIHDVVDEVSAAHPERPIRVGMHGEQRGSWDVARLSQALGNPIANAVQHGADGTSCQSE